MEVIMNTNNIRLNPENKKHKLKVAHHDTFEAGALWQKQQMMKDAVDAKVDLDLDGNIKLDCEYEFHVGDKVKIIIVKTEQQ